MSVEGNARQEEGWREAGRRVAPLLRSYTAAVVTGHDERAAAFAALGIADTEAPYRSVVIANLWGTPAIDPLIDAAEDAPGVSDCFTYGISLTSAAQVSSRNERLAIIGSGTEPMDQFQVFRSRRWKAYSERLLEAGSLLLLLAPAEADSVHELIAQVDGIVLLGVNLVPSAPHARVIARITDPIMHREESREETGFPWKRTLTIAASLLLIAAGVAAGLKYFWLRQPIVAPAPITADSAITAASSTPESAGSSTAAIAGLPPISNPADSATSARFSVEILAANTQSGAIFTLRKYRATIPAGTVSAIPVGPDQALWYKVIGGAFAKREDADSLLVSLRRKKIIPDSAGAVVETPLAFLVDTIAADAGMMARVKKSVDSLAKGGISPYGLTQADGSARVYTGAFSTAAESKQYADQLRSAGMNPVLVYRTGRYP
ncbi:MAG: hypothetical protein H0U64_11570 [Gemmatimonadaceae bacterium]|nr:hypothetical protein [Gemmatimonadaceae bacterium]